MPGCWGTNVPGPTAAWQKEIPLKKLYALMLACVLATMALGCSSESATSGEAADDRSPRERRYDKDS